MVGSALTLRGASCVRFWFLKYVGMTSANLLPYRYQLVHRYSPAAVLLKPPGGRQRPQRRLATRKSINTACSIALRMCLVAPIYIAVCLHCVKNCTGRNYFNESMSPPPIFRVFQQPIFSGNLICSNRRANIHQIFTAECKEVRASSTLPGPY